MASRGIGRPRSRASTSGLSTEEDILRAAATLFCEVGYGSTSTYAIAESAGISQASMYHYFGGKHAILLALLLRTVEPSVAVATALLDRGEPAEARLWALCSYDVRLLVSGEQNTGSLYLLPELSDERFAEFHVERQRLADVYAGLVAAVGARVAGGAAAEASWLVFGLVESVILRRRTGSVGGDVAGQIADAALRVLGVPEDRIAAARADGEALLHSL
ncbi:TetR/AcrR family transcriptional regulator [Nocardioides sp. SOB77]|uniref:TetR/AcrR family transcriptional regulator n=1 Tax=Nocardioides oceani TaxID=3058369 RepID=A0ABT8FA29_9ACTN|nr:TetR/AcrR family transcriptional regulator [Nocardioides oceani]MDN4171532.1 TetR/AcrR family transcriptional regulator [Nocardioides oceani]